MFKGNKGGKNRVYKTTPTPGRASKPKGGPLGRLQAMAPRQKKLAILVAGLLGLLVICLVVFALVMAQPGEKPGVDSSLSGSLSGSTASLPPEEDYDKDANSIPVSQLVGTILPETERAEPSYAEETLFLGDSNTARMQMYRDITYVTLANSIGIEGMGIQGVTTYRGVRFKGHAASYTMAEAVALMQPQRIVITFGTNNVGFMKVEAFIEEYKKALDALHEAYEYADIIIGAVPPIDRYHSAQGATMTAIDEYNVALAELADKEGYKFLNWSEAMKDKESGFCVSEYTYQDGYHLTRAGMEAMFNYFFTHSYITEDRRPKPLDPIPELDGQPAGLITHDPSKGSGPYTSSGSGSEQEGSVNVVFSVYCEAEGAATGGTVKVAGSKGAASLTLKKNPGDICPDVEAKAAKGYRFLGWVCSVGSISNTASPTLSGFQVYPTPYVNAGDTVTVTALFEKLPEESSVAPSSDSSSKSEKPASSKSEKPASSKSEKPASSKSEKPASSKSEEPPASSSKPEEPPSSSSQPEEPPPASVSVPEEPDPGDSGAGGDNKEGGDAP